MMEELENKSYFRNKVAYKKRNIDAESLWTLEYIVDEACFVLVDDDEFVKFPFQGNSDYFYEVDTPKELQ